MVSWQWQARPAIGGYRSKHEESWQKVTIAAEHELEVRVTGGMIRGIQEERFRAWRGIPYAAPPVGSRRFRSPLPVVGWSGIRDCSRFGKVATQAYHGQFRGVGPGIPSGEDCLTVNVLTSADVGASAGGLPVMVFIHGGGYSAGSSQDFAGQGEGFVQSGRVVYLSFNYRLGALGYLDFTRYSTPQRPIDSNLGLRDQVAALEWVRDNIAAFGGDAGNVTVFGESAGGNAVTTLLATPSADGLFARAIAQSAPVNAVYAPEQAAAWATEFISILRNDGDGDEPAGEAEANTLLTTTEATDLVTAALTLQIRTPESRPGTFCLAPVVDGAFLPQRPLAALRSGAAHRVPLIIGTNAHEGSIFRGRVDILPKSVGRIRTVFRQAPKKSHAIMQAAYPGLPDKRQASDFAGDYGFWFPSVMAADLHSRFAPVHAYRFDVAPRLMHLLGLDATHGVEMFALFDQTKIPIARAMTALGGRATLEGAGNRMRRYWLDFATKGVLPESWPAYTEDARRTLIIDEVDQIESDPHRERRLAWEAFLPEI